MTHIDPYEDIFEDRKEKITKKTKIQKKKEYAKEYKIKIELGKYTIIEEINKRIPNLFKLNEVNIDVWDDYSDEWKSSNVNVFNLNFTCKTKTIWKDIEELVKYFEGLDLIIKNVKVEST